MACFVLLAVFCANCCCRLLYRTINVEYNQLDPLLRDNGFKDGDVNDEETGFSPFPGNINQLLFRADAYLEALERTEGIMPEFVNPKYKTSRKVDFKKPTRLECMMQVRLRDCVGFNRSFCRHYSWCVGLSHCVGVQGR